MELWYGTNVTYTIWLSIKDRDIDKKYLHNHKDGFFVGLRAPINSLPGTIRIELSYIIKDQERVAVDEMLATVLPTPGQLKGQYSITTKA